MISDVEKELARLLQNWPRNKRILTVRKENDSFSVNFQPFDLKVVANILVFKVVLDK